MSESSDCLICKKHANPPVPSGEIYSDEYWSVIHSHETNILGYFFIEAKRHFLDLGDATVQEAIALGLIQQNLIRALKSVLKCERVYVVALGEAVPHCHFHVIPRRQDMPKAFRGRGIMTYPLQPVADAALVSEVCERVRAALGKRKFTLASGSRR